MARAKKTEPSIEAFNPSSYFPAPTLPDVSKAPDTTDKVLFGSMTKG